MEKLDDILGKMTEFLKTEAKTETIIGQQFTLGGFTCVPVISIGFGIGGGGGEGKGSAPGKGEGGGFGAAGGAGMSMSPVGFLATKGEEIQFIPAHNSKGLSAMFEKLPDLLEKYLDKQKADQH